MASTARAILRARRTAEADRIRAGSELRDARIAAGLSIRDVAAAAGIGASQVSRIERGRQLAVSGEQLAVLGAIVGLDVRTRTYRGGDPLRDTGHIRLLERLRAILPSHVRLHTEQPLPIDGDQRAWDGSMFGLDGVGGLPSKLDVEAETRIADLQAQTRRIALKARDAGAAYVLVIVADTKANREAVRAASASLMADFPIPARQALAAIREGRHPGGSALIFL